MGVALGLERWTPESRVNRVRTLAWQSHCLCSFKASLHRRFLSRNSMQFLSRWSCNQLRFLPNFSSVCQCKVSTRLFGKQKLSACSKVKLLLKVTEFNQLHVTEIAAGLHARFWSCNFSASRLGLNCATKIADVNGSLQVEWWNGRGLMGWRVGHWNPQWTEFESWLRRVTVSVVLARSVTKRHLTVRLRCWRIYRATWEVLELGGNLVTSCFRNRIITNILCALSSHLSVAVVYISCPVVLKRNCYVGHTIR